MRAKGEERGGKRRKWVGGGIKEGVEKERKERKGKERKGKEREGV